jgi:hypothetical integral membrane protein (TIGR02206 family)
MNHHEVIELFSLTWWTGLGASLLCIMGILVAGKNANHRNKKRIARITGSFLFFVAVFIHLYQYHVHEWKLQSSLPLNLCSLSGILSGIALLFPQQLAFEFILFWGIPSGIHSLITPEMTLGSNGWYLYDYYICHAGMILSALYLVLVSGMRPGRFSWLKVFAWTQLLMIVVGLVDYMTGSNYMYLVAKPSAANPMVIGAWPWYILGFEIAGMVHFYVVYLIFKKRTLGSVEK